MKGDISKKKKDADDFYELCEIEWNDTVSATALKTLKEKKWNKPQMLPIVKYISSLHTHLKVHARG